MRTLAENFHLQIYFLKISVLISLCLKHYRVVIKANIHVSQTVEHPKPKATQANGGKKKCTFAIAEQKEAMKDVFWRRGDRVDFKKQKYLT